MVPSFVNSKLSRAVSSSIKIEQDFSGINADGALIHETGNSVIRNTLDFVRLVIALLKSR
jgi:hypothetical protein